MVLIPELASVVPWYWETQLGAFVSVWGGQVCWVLLGSKAADSEWPEARLFSSPDEKKLGPTFEYSMFFPKQFTVGVLNATLNLAALVLVGVVGFLGSEVVLSPVVSGCLPSCGRWVLVGVVGFLGSEVVLSPVVSHCLRLSPFMWGGCWLVWSASWTLKWSCLLLSPIVSGCLPSCGVGVGWCGRLLGL